MSSKARLFFLILFISFPYLAPLGAEQVPIGNPSFEADALCEGCNAISITGWATSPGGGDGVFNPTAAQYPGGVVPDGENVAYVNLSGNSVRQILTAVLEADRRYTLRVEVGNRLDEAFAGYRVQLRAGGVVLAEDNSSLTPAPGEFVTSTVTYDATAFDPQLGQPLEIWLLSPGVQANFDQVRLERKISVANPSFEADVLCDGCNAISITDWETSPGGGDGVSNPTTAQYPGGVVPDGENVAYVNLSGNSVRQILTAVLEADRRYTLKVEVGNRLDEAFAGYRVQLRAGGVVLAEDDSSLTPAPGEFVTSTVSYDATAFDPQLGQPLEIWLLSPGVQANFDDVCLSAAVPIFSDGFESGGTSSWSSTSP
ncbi:MAG: hypothetical protein GY719_15115 [bacterium]|nr:hypothetical protein [bacterium]